MFKSTPQASQFIPVKKLQINPEAQVTYNSKNQTQIRFVLDSYIGYMDPRTSRIQYQLNMTGRGRPQPNPRCGASALIRDWRIEDGMAAATLEEVLDSNVLTAQTWAYSQNPSITHKRTMFEGQSNTPKVGESMYWSNDAGANGDWNAAPVTTANEQTAKTLQIQHTLFNSGLLGGGQDSKVFPLVATKGLRLHMNLENAQRACVFQTGNLGVSETGDGTNVCSLGNALVEADGTKVAMEDTFHILIEIPTVAATSGLSGVNVIADGEYNNNPFSIGDSVWCGSDGGADGESIGIITQMKADAQGALELEICHNVPVGEPFGYAHPIGSPVYVRPSDRVNGLPASPNVPADLEPFMTSQLDYFINNVEYLVCQVSPPSGYVEAMLSQVNSSKGMVIDFRCWSTYRNTLSALNGLTTQWIPTEATRAYSCLSTPLSQNKQLGIEYDSFRPETNGARNYQYSHGNKLIPDRPVHLERNSQTIPKPNALALIELEKALVNSGVAVRDLQRSPEKFNIGRAFSRYGGTANMAGQTLSLRVEYSGATDRLMFNNYIHQLRRIKVQGSNITAD